MQMNKNFNRHERKKRLISKFNDNLFFISFLKAFFYLVKILKNTRTIKIYIAKAETSQPI